MGANGTLSKRQSFYESQSHKLARPIKWIRETLARYFDKFDPDKLKEYAEVLKDEDYLERTKDRLLKKYGKPLIQHDPCPCGAVMISDRDLGSVCSIGGTLHLRAQKLAERMDRPFADVLLELEEGLAKREAEFEEIRKRDWEALFPHVFKEKEH